MFWNKLWFLWFCSAFFAAKQFEFELRNSPVAYFQCQYSTLGCLLMNSSSVDPGALDPIQALDNALQSLSSVTSKLNSEIWALEVS